MGDRKIISVKIVEVETQQESTATKRMCPLKNLVLLDVFPKIISNSSRQDTASSSINKLDKYLNDLLIGYKIGDSYNSEGNTIRSFLHSQILLRVS